MPMFSLGILLRTENSGPLDKDNEIIQFEDMVTLVGTGLLFILEGIHMINDGPCQNERIF
jgi:hypothetical protein